MFEKKSATTVRAYLASTIVSNLVRGDTVSNPTLTGSTAADTRTQQLLVSGNTGSYIYFCTTNGNN